MSDDKDLPEILDIEIEPVLSDDELLEVHLSEISAPGSHSDISRSSVSRSSSSHSSPSAPSGDPSGEDPFIGLRLKNMYELVSKIGEGGMGNVYAAIQYPLERKVAIKVLKPSESNPQGEHYFMREVQAINMLRHPNIISILDFGKEPGGLLYLVMEHLPGRTLKDVIKHDYPLDPRRVCNILIQLLSALQQAHTTGIVHCDLKPANIMLEEVAGQADFVKVLDFGIAKVKGPALEVGPYTQAGNIVGTFDYMSPEQIMRKELDGRADIWSVGVILYEMLTRRRVFHDKDAVSIIGRVMQMPIEKPSRVAKNGAFVPPQLERIALKAMERNVKKRYQSAEEMRAALQQALQELEAGPGSSPGASRSEASDTGSHSSSLSGSYSSSLSRSGLVRGSGPHSSPHSASRSGPHQAIGAGGDTGRTGLSSIFSRSGNFGFGSGAAGPSGVGLGDSQRLATAIAQGTSILDQTFGVDGLENSLLGERRKVAVVAIQQRARRKEGLDPEEIARRSAGEAAIIREVIAHYDGELDSSLGGTYTVLFGARKARIGDTRRAVECAVALQARFRALDQGAEHIGIGLVFGEVFVSDRRGGNAYGEAIDRAVEIARAVREARIFVDDALQELTREAVRYDAPRQIAGDSASEVLDLQADVARAQAEADVGLAEVEVYVPRPALFDELSRRAAQARAGQGGGVAILGDLGTGKTVLLERFLDDQQQAGWQTFVVRHRDVAGQQNLAAIRAWIRQIARTYKDPHTLVRKACESIGLKQNVDPVIAFYLGEAGDTPPAANELPWHDSKGLIHFTAALLYRMVRFAMKKGPVLLAIDDINAEDHLGMAFLDSLLAGIERQPILVVATHRIESTALDHGLPGNFEILQLGGFNENESRQFVAQMLGYTPPIDIVAHLHMRSSGNPMFLREVVRAVLKQGGGRLPEQAELLEQAVPFNLQELLAARLDALPDELRDLLAIASVLGESFREEFFFQVVPTHLDPYSGLQDLVALNVLEASFDAFERVHVAFNPRALRRVIYDRLPKAARAQIHARIIEFLEQAPDVAAVDPLEYPLMVAFHYRSVEGREGAAYYLVRAGAILLDMYDYQTAIEHLDDAIELLREQQVAPDHAIWLEAHAHILIALRESGRIEDARRLTDALPPLDQIPGRVALELMYEKGLIDMEAGSIQDSLRALEWVKNSAAEGGHFKLELKALLALAQLFEKENQLSQAASLLMEVSKKVEQVGELDLQDPDDRRLTWTAYNQLGTLFIRQRDYQRAQQFLNAALQQARAIEDYRGLVRILSNMGALCLSIRDVKMATRYFSSAVSFAQGTGDLLNQARILTNLGITALEANDLESSKQHFRQARTIAEEIGWYEGLAELSLHIKRLKQAIG